MPYKVVGRKVVKKSTGKVVGVASSHAKAKAMVRAIYASENKKRG